MLKIYKPWILVLFFVLAALPVYAGVTIQLDVKPSFTEGEKVSFTYTFLSDKDEEIVYIPTVNCPTAEIPLLWLEEVQLKKDIPFTEEYVYFDILESNIEPQLCRFSVSVIEPFELSKGQEFEIVTNPSFEFDLFFCKDEACSEKSKVFIQSEDVYLDYTSSIENPSITATLTYPDKTTKQITLPTSIKAEQIGEHELKVSASKENYKSVTKTEQFTVVEKDVVIESESWCNGDGICDEKENYQTCPQDCPRSLIKEKKEKIELNFLTIIIIAIIILIIGIVVIYFYLFKHKKEDMGG